ncbi:MAG: Ribose ABC transport system, permease protein RbsC, partial [uncultured Solirubrobacteraceae bacterium]
EHRTGSRSRAAPAALRGAQPPHRAAGVHAGGRRGADPGDRRRDRAGVVPDLGQHAQRPAPGERGRCPGDRHDLRHRHRRHRPVGRLDGGRRLGGRRAARRVRQRDVHPRHDRHGRAARRHQRGRHRVRPGRSLHRHAGHVHDGARAGAVDERQDADLDLRARGSALVRHRTGARHSRGGGRLPRGHGDRLGAAESHALRALRDRRRRQPRGRPHRRRQRLAHRVQRLRPERDLRRHRRHPGGRPALERLADRRDALRARRHRGGGDRRHGSRGRSRDHRRDLPRRHHLRADLQPADVDGPRRRDPAGHQGPDHPRRRPRPAARFV